MTSWDLSEFLALLAIGLVGFLIDWIRSVSAKLDRIIALLDEARS